MKVVSNTSPISELAKIGRLDILQSLFETIVIPDEVRIELHRHPRRPLISPLAWIISEAVDPNSVRALRQKTGLGSGESAAIVLAIKQNADLLLLDDLDARRYAYSLSLPLVGTVGVLLRAKSVGVIHALHPILDLLRNAGARISDSLYRDALTRAGETI